MCRGLEPLGLRLPRWRDRMVGRAHPTARRGRSPRVTIDCALARGAMGGRARLRRPVPRQLPHLRARRSGATSSTTIPRSSDCGRSSRRPGLPVTFHVSTGRDPRAVGGNGGAIINYVCHSMETTIEPLVQLITSGVFERHPAHAGRARRVGHRVRAVAARDDGLRVQGTPLLGAPGDPRAAVGVLPAPLLRDVPGGPRRRAGGRAATTSSTTSCGRTTTPTTRGRGRTRRRRSSVRWATSADESRAKILGGNAVRVFSL